MTHMRKCGFSRYTPVCKTWHSAYILKRDGAALCVLLRKNGIDFRYYENYNRNIQINREGLISLNGGEIYRNYYNEAEDLITLKVKIITSCFAAGRINNDFRHEDGRSYLENPNYEKIRQRSREKYKNVRAQLMLERQEAREWRSITRYLQECGGYLGDGIYV